MTEKPLWKRVGIQAARAKSESQTGTSVLHQKPESETSTFLNKQIDTSNESLEIFSKMPKAHNTKKTPETKKNQDELFFRQFMDDFKRYGEQEKSCISEQPEEQQGDSLKRIGPLGPDDTIASSFNTHSPPKKHHKLLYIIRPQFERLKSELKEIRKMVTQQEKELLGDITELQMIGTILLSKPSIEDDASANQLSTLHAQDSVGNSNFKSRLSDMTTCPQNQIRQNMIDKTNAFQLQYQQLKSQYESTRATNSVLETCLKNQRNRLCMELQLQQNKNNKEMDTLAKRFDNQLQQLKTTYEKIIEGNESTIRALKKDIDIRVQLLVIADRREKDALEMARHCSDNIYALKYKKMYEEAQTETQDMKQLNTKLQEEIQEMRYNLQQERKHSKCLFEDTHKKTKELEELRQQHQVQLQEVKKTLLREHNIKTGQLRQECKFLRESLEEKQRSLQSLTMELQEVQNTIKTMEGSRNQEATQKLAQNTSEEEYFPKLKNTQSYISYATIKNKGIHLNKFIKNEELHDDQFSVCHRPFNSDRQTKKNFRSSQLIGVASVQSPKDCLFSVNMDTTETPPNRLGAAHKQKMHLKTEPSALSARAEYLSKMIKNEIQSSIRRHY